MTRYANDYSQAVQAPNRSFFLLGPRDVGKSTYLRNTFPDAHVIDLLSEATFQGLLANPGMLAAELRAVPDGQWVVLDEIQRLPSLLNEVHRFIEERKLRFVLCGSSARKLKRALLPPSVITPIFTAITQTCTLNLVIHADRFRDSCAFSDWCLRPVVAYTDTAHV